MEVRVALWFPFRSNPAAGWLQNRDYTGPVEQVTDEATYNSLLSFSGGNPKPSWTEVQSLWQQFQDAEAAAKLARRNRKRNLLTKLGMSAGEIQALVELVQDAHDN